MRSAARTAWKAIHLPAAGARATSRAAEARDLLAAGIERVLIDTAGGPHPGGTGQRIDTDAAAAVGRDVPVILAGGLSAANVAAALRDIPAVGVDVASGVEWPRAAGERPRKDPLRVALFVKRARAARDDRPNTAFGPTPVHAGLLDADGHGRWGMERDFGGRYVPETLMSALMQLETAYDALRHDPAFWADLRLLLERFAGRPTALYRADRLAAAVEAEAARLGAAGARPAAGIRLYLKREDLAHTGAHKINNALGQALLTRRLGKSRVIAETGAGQHGVATATACALLDLPCVVYMGAEDIERQGPNVLRMRALGAEVRSVTSGTATLKDAVNEAMRDWVTNVETTHYVLGSAMGPHPYPTIVRDLQRRIGDEAAAPADRRRRPPARPGDRVRRRRIERDRAARAVHRGAGGPPRGGRGRRRRDGHRAPRRRDRRRDAGHPARLALAHAPGPRRAGHRGAFRVGRARLPGHRTAAGRTRGGRPDRGRDGHRPRGRGSDEGDDPHRGHPAGARDGPRDRRPAQGPRWRRRPAPAATRPTRWSCSASPGRGDKDLAALERFDDVEPWASAR